MVTTVSAYVFASFRFDESSGLFRENVPTRIAPRVRSLLLALLKAGGNAVPRKDLIAVCADGATNADASLDRAVYLLRKALRDEHQRIIKTDYGRGLRVGVPIRLVSATRVPGSAGTLRINDGYPHAATGEEMIRTAFELASSRTDQGFRLAGDVLANAVARFPGLAQAPSLHADIEVSRMIRGYVRPAAHAKHAFALVDKALGIAPGLPSALATKGWLVGVVHDDMSSGLLLIDEALLVTPTAWIAKFYKSWLLIGARQMEAAATTLEEALKISPFERALLSLKGWLLCAMSHMDDAATFVDDAITMRPDVDLLWIVQAIIRVRRGEFEGARQSMAQALALAPRDTVVQANEAWLNALCGRSADAQDYLLRRAKSPGTYVPPVMLSIVRNALSDGVGSANLLKIADVDKDPWRLLAWCDPRFKGSAT